MSCGEFMPEDTVADNAACFYKGGEGTNEKFVNKTEGAAGINDRMVYVSVCFLGYADVFAGPGYVRFAVSVSFLHLYVFVIPGSS